MTWPRMIVSICAVAEAGWMAFDGTQALLTGHLVTPRTGAHAGELGPWRHLVQLAGVDPAGTVMQMIFAVFGGVWLLIVVGFALRRPWGWPAMVTAAMGSLWFLPVGTLLSLVQLAFLFGFRTHLGDAHAD